MRFTNKQLRVGSRWIHLLGAWLIGAFVYSPGRDEAGFVLLMQFGVIPILTLTGVVMWKQALVGRWLGTNRKEAVAMNRGAHVRERP